MKNRQTIRFMAILYAALAVLWLGIDTFAAMTLRNRMAELQPVPIGAGAVIRNLGLVECLALSSAVWGRFFPQARRVGLPGGVVVETSRCIAPGPGSRSSESWVRVIRVA